MGFFAKKKTIAKIKEENTKITITFTSGGVLHVAPSPRITALDFKEGDTIKFKTWWGKLIWVVKGNHKVRIDS